MRMMWLSVLVAMSGCVPAVNGDAGVEDAGFDSGVEDAGFLEPAACLVELKAACGADAGKTNDGLECIYDGEFDGGNGSQTHVFTAAGARCATVIRFRSGSSFCEVPEMQWRDADGNVVATGVFSNDRLTGARCTDGGIGGWVAF